LATEPVYRTVPRTHKEAATWARPEMQELEEALTPRVNDGMGDATPAPAPTSPTVGQQEGWFYTTAGQKPGKPVSMAALQGLAASGRLKPTDFVWRPGMANWAPANTVQNLFGENRAEVELRAILHGISASGDPDDAQAYYYARQHGISEQRLDEL